MPVRIAWILPLVWLPLNMLGQEQPPPAVDQALRARVTEFLQYHVDGNFRKAYDMVADDTKDDYFNSGKVQLQGFKIDDVKFTDNFTKASVIATMSKIVNVMGQQFPMATPSATTWKVENGKWVWYNDTQRTWGTPVVGPPSVPPGTTSASSATSNDNAILGLPKDFDDKAIAAAARSILQQVSVDKKEVTLAVDKPSEEKVIFHNGMTGSVQLELIAPEDVPGFTVKLGQSMVRAAADVPLVFRYEPDGDKARRDPVNVQLIVQPLNQVFVIRVNFAATGPVVTSPN